MKKIILGCAAVLLSIGLLAGCNNKEDEPPITEAVSLSVSQTSVNLEPGGSATVTYTVDPAEATVMALSDHEEYVTAVAQEGTIYLEAVAAGTAIVSVGAEYEGYASAEAQITVTVAEVVEPEPGLPEIELVVDPISEPLVVDGDPVEVTYSVDPEDAEIEMEVANEAYATVAYLDPEVDEIDSIEEAGWYLTPVAEGETTLTVTASLDEYETASVEVDIRVHKEGYTPLTTRESYTLTVTFANPIPTYADAYITGYLAGGTSGTWVNYEIDSTGKMIISEDRYSASYVLSNVAVGDIAINVYFEYNSNAQYHEAAMAATWTHNVFEGDATWAVISDDEYDSETVLYVETDPSTIITDNNDFCELTIAIKDTSGSGFSEGFAPYFYHWAYGADNDPNASAFVSMNQGACGEYTTSSDYYFTVKTDGTTLDGSQTYYRISQGDEFKFQISVTTGSNQWHDAITIASGTTVPSEVEAYDSSRDIIIKGVGTSCESALVVFEFDFSACQTKDAGTWESTPYNALITNITYVSGWTAAAE